MIFAMIPGDARQSCLRQLLRDDGHDTPDYYPGLKADCYVFPLPTGRHPMLETLPAGSLVLAGQPRGDYPQLRLRDYYARHMDDGTFVAWLALEDGKIIGTGGMSFVEKPPYFGCPNGRIGLLSSMYTRKECRRQGIGKTLLGKVVEEARAYGCGAVQITASDMGTLLYADFGFRKNGNFMQYNL